MIYQSPALLGSRSVVLNEAQTLGTVAWLLLHSELHKGLAIGQLATLYLPAIKSGQYLLGIEHDTAVFYVSWAKMGLEEERLFLTHGPLSVTAQTWQSGDRVWFMDWVAPFGHSSQVFKYLREQLWAQGLARALYLPPNREREMRLMELHGAGISPAIARNYFESSPLAAALPKRLTP